MPAIYRVEFPVRSYETDGYGHVNQANYLRYMQEAAVQASAAVGYDDARYRALGTVWLIRETQIEYMHELRYGDTVEVTTWVGDFRRVRSRRFYELRRTRDGERVATATSDWVYLHRESGRPLAVPAEMIAAFAAGDTVTQAEERPRYPGAPQPPAQPYTQVRRVEWRDIDSAGHVNNANYLSYMEESGVVAAAHFGWTMQRMQAEGFAIVARRHRIEYRQQATLGEDLHCTTYLYNLRRSTVGRYYAIHRASDGELIAQSRSKFVCVSLATGAPMRFPPAMDAAFAVHLSPDGDA
jgi:acyl-CoA thioester hydrolase